MRRRLASLLVICCLSLSIAACGHEHVWKDATCTEPATCEECGATEGEPLGHDWVEATHETPETCSRCGETRGDVLLYDTPPGLTEGHAFGEFDTYNSYASENGLGDTMIWFNGSYDTVSTLDMPDVQSGLQAYIALTTDDDGNVWLIEIDLNEYTPIDRYESLEGHRLCILGQYQGYSDVYQTPVVLVEKIYDRTTGDLIVPAWFAEAM